MPVILKDSAAGGGLGGSASSASWSHTIGVGPHPYLLVGISAEVAAGNSGNLTVTGVTFNGVALTRITGRTWTAIGSESRAQNLDLWYLDSNSMPAPGTYTITVTFTGSIDAWVGGSVSFFNVHQGAPEASATNQNTNSASISTAVTSVTANAMIVDVAGDQNTGTYTTPGGQIQDITENVGGPGHCLVMSHVLAGAAGSYTMQETHSNSESQAQIAVSLPFMAAAQGGMM